VFWTVKGQRLIVASFPEESAGAAAGMQIGDELLAVEGCAAPCDMQRAESD